MTFLSTVTKFGHNIQLYHNVSISQSKIGHVSARVQKSQDVVLHVTTKNFTSDILAALLPERCSNVSGKNLILNGTLQQNVVVMELSSE